jgi:pectate lyase
MISRTPGKCYAKAANSIPRDAEEEFNEVGCAAGTAYRFSQLYEVPTMQYSRSHRWGFCACLVASLVANSSLAVPAFPGAEGCGANATGGRGGSVYFVTNLNDTGAGSLRNGITTASGPRTILFNVSGTIELQSDLTINKPNLTIAGQTAPGDGITLKRRLTSIQNTRDVIMRFIRCRAGDADSTFQDDSMHVIYGTNIVVDHVSSSWSVDECMSVTWSTNVSIQWCMITESLNKSQHDKGTHGYGSLLRYGEGAYTFHHNLYQHHNSRNPRLGDRLKLDFVNNVVYNWGFRAGYSGGNGATEDAKDNPGGVFTNYLNYLYNYLVAGPSSTTPNTAFASGATNTVIYQSGNRIDPNKNGALDGTDTGWGMFNTFPYTVASSPYPFPAVTTNSAAVAYERVMAFVGASQVRDSVDLRLIGNVRAQTGQLVDAVGPGDQLTDYVTNTINGTNYVFVRGWPTLNSTTPPLDADQDGIPDYWELALGWNPVAANNNHTNADGYTDLEWYLNWLAAPRAVCDRNGSVDVSLRLAAGSSTNLSFSVANGTNGTVSLLGDGYTAHFVATNDYTGMASFSFSATNNQTGVGFGPVTVAVLITTTNAIVPNTTPVLAAVSNRTLLAGITLAFTNSATDTDQPPQTLTYSLLNAPTGASVNSSNGIFAWRPAIAQSGSSNFMAVVVADNGTPNLSATQSFSVVVTRPIDPSILSSGFTNGLFNLAVTGDSGPDYSVLASTNLTAWSQLYTTNSPALPFLWTDGETNFSQRFYRIQLGP